MNTPICDFVTRYAGSDALRLHMPGHKGTPLLGMEPLDITEIPGADSLYEAEGIIQESEGNASRLFGCPTLYSTEGSSQCIRGMLYLTLLYARQTGRKPLIAAGRNAHKTFLSALALLDLDVLWLVPEGGGSYLSCRLEPEDLDRALASAPEKPVAVYLTSPDYLGNLVDVAAMARVCRRHDVLLLIDNAHGAYLGFLTPSRHPVALGAHLCCDSAHKTLPALTGGAYLHIAPCAPALLKEQARQALALFGSTSPSYLILQSLDAVNGYLEDHPRRLRQFLPKLESMKQELTSFGYLLTGDEPLKITIRSKPFGYTGNQLASLLWKAGIVCEFSDPDYLVLMVTPETGPEGLRRLGSVLLGIPRKAPIPEEAPVFRQPRRVCSVRQALLSPPELIPVEESLGRVLAAANVGCPPAVPIVACGEEIDRHALACFSYYGIKTCMVLRKDPRK